MHTNAYADSRVWIQEQTDRRWEGKSIWTEFKSQQENVAVNDRDRANRESEEEQGGSGFSLPLIIDVRAIYR